MSVRDYEYDVFISWSGDRERAERIHKTLKACGVRSFISSEVEPGVEWPIELLESIRNSRQLALLWSAAASESRWVQREIGEFLARSVAGEGAIYISAPPGSPAPPLAAIQRCEDDHDLVAQFGRMRFAELSNRTEDTERKLRLAEDSIQKNLGPHVLSKLWRDFASDGVVHISTCGRNVGPSEGRGPGGRTNLDIWDYKTVLDLTRFLSRDHPSIRIELDDPLAKIESSDQISDRTLLVEERLRGKNYIIIGSPDVSDLAEVGFAKLHRVHPYRGETEKLNGYVIVKDAKATAVPSSVYRPSKDGEPSGVERIADQRRPFECTESSARGETYGILAIFKCPGGGSLGERNVMILSGFTGIATNGIARLLTDPTHLTQLNRLLEDRQENKPSQVRGIEALIRIRYESARPAAVGVGPLEGDTRRFEASEHSIEYVELVTI
jgi:hypothetical protein